MFIFLDYNDTLFNANISEGTIDETMAPLHSVVGPIEVFGELPYRGYTSAFMVDQTHLLYSSPGHYGKPPWVGVGDWN